MCCELAGAADAVRAMLPLATEQWETAMIARGANRPRDAMEVVEGYLSPPQYWDVRQVEAPQGAGLEGGVAWFELLLLSQWCERGTVADNMERLERRAEQEGRVDWEAVYGELYKYTKPLDEIHKGGAVWNGFSTQNTLSGSDDRGRATNLKGFQSTTAQQHAEAESAATAAELAAGRAGRRKDYDMWARAARRHLALQPCGPVLVDAYAAPEHYVHMLSSLRCLSAQELARRAEAEADVYPGLAQLVQLVAEGRATEAEAPGLFARRGARGAALSYTCQLSQVWTWGMQVGQHVERLEEALQRSGATGAGAAWDREKLDVLRGMAEECCAVLPEQRPMSEDLLPRLGGWHRMQRPQQQRPQQRQQQRRRREVERAAGRLGQEARPQEVRLGSGSGTSGFRGLGHGGGGAGGAGGRQQQQGQQGLGMEAGHSPAAPPPASPYAGCWLGEAMQRPTPSRGRSRGHLSIIGR